MEQVADDYEPIRPVKQDEDPNETTTTPAAPPEFEGSPSSHLRSKTKQQTTSIQQDLPERNPSTMDPLECNPAQIEANEVQIVPGIDIFVQWTCTLLWAKRVSKHKAPVAARCALMVAMAVDTLKCNQTKVKTVQ